MASRRSSQLSYSRALARQYSPGSVQDLVEREAVAEGVVEAAEGDMAGKLVARADARAGLAQDRDRRVEVVDAEAQRLALAGRLVGVELEVGAGDEFPFEDARRRLMVRRTAEHAAVPVARGDDVGRRHGDRHALQAKKHGAPNNKSRLTPPRPGCNVSGRRKEESRVGQTQGGVMNRVPRLAATLA